MTLNMIEKMVEKNSLIAFSSWLDIHERLASSETINTLEEWLHHFGIDHAYYTKIINLAVDGWKESTSRSLFQFLGVRGLEIPKEGEQIFQSHLEQTRFFYLLDEAKIINKWSLNSVRDENHDILKVKGQKALTYPLNEDRKRVLETKVNDVLKAIYLYVCFCKKKESYEGLKFPKKLYRGVRLGDLYRVPAIAEKIKDIKWDGKSESRFFCDKQRVEIAMQHIEKNGLNSIAESPLLSFTASKQIAKYFANKNGIVLEINASDAEILTSEAHDHRFAEKDYFSDKLEREYIVRLSEEKVKVSGMMVYDLDYMIATNSPMAVNLLDHNDKMAFYELNNVPLKAIYTWFSNTKGRVLYYKLDEGEEGIWGYSSREFAKKYGFSPVVSHTNLKNISNFRIEKNHLYR